MRASSVPGIFVPHVSPKLRTFSVRMNESHMTVILEREPTFKSKLFLWSYQLGHVTRGKVGPEVPRKGLVQAQLRREDPDPTTWRTIGLPAYRTSDCLLIGNVTLSVRAPNRTP